MLDVHELQKIIDTHVERRIWHGINAKDNPASAEVAARVLAELPPVTALEALEAATRLMKLTAGRRWIDVMYAREQGATWAEVGAAVDMTADEAQDWYAAKIADQARYVGDLHDSVRAEAAL